MIYIVITIVVVILGLLIYFVLPFIIYWYSTIQASAWKEVFLKSSKTKQEEKKEAN